MTRANASGLRVLHVITTGERRGAEMFAADLIRELDRAGGVEQEVAVLRGSWPPLVEYQARSHRLTPHPAQGGGRWTGLDPAIAWRLRSIDKKWRPHVVQAHGGEPLRYAAAAVWRRDRIVYRRIGLSPERATRGPAGLAYRQLVRRCRKIIAVADAVRRETIESFRVPPDRVVTIPRGVDPSRLAPTMDRRRSRERLGISPDAPVVLSLGALSWEKDPMAQLSVMDGVRRRFPGAVHLVAGDGPLRREVEEFADRAGLDGGIRILGSRSDVGDLFAAADLLLLTSRVEGMPGCVIEAGMSGVPVVAFSVAGVPEVVDDGETGFLVEPGRTDVLVARTVDLLGDPTLRARMGEAARTRCRAYDIGLVGPRYLEIYQEARR